MRICNIAICVVPCGTHSVVLTPDKGLCEKCKTYQSYSSCAGVCNIALYPVRGHQLTKHGAQIRYDMHCASRNKCC